MVTKSVLQFVLQFETTWLGFRCLPNQICCLRLGMIIACTYTPFVSSFPHSHHIHTCIVHSCSSNYNILRFLNTTYHLYCTIHWCWLDLILRICTAFVLHYYLLGFWKASISNIYHSNFLCVRKNTSPSFCVRTWTLVEDMMSYGVIRDTH